MHTRHSQRCTTRTGLSIAVVMAIACSANATSARAIELSRSISDLYSSVSAYPPSANAMTVCYGFMCRRRYGFDFSAADRAALTRIMAAGKSSAVAERAAVQKAVVWFDLRLGPVIGTNKRIANADFRYFDDKHNYDCWDTTRNVTGLMVVMQGWGLFKYHAVGDPHYRGNVLVLQTPHNTPVLVDQATRTEWVVDMWPRGYAQMPDVMPVERWVKEN